MITQVRIENFYSIGPAEKIDFVINSKVAKNGYYQISNDKKVSLVNGFWGANASGKSNVLRAITLILAAMKGDLGGIVQNFNKEFANRPTKLGIDIVLNKTLYRYDIELLGESITEVLAIKKDGEIKASMVYERCDEKPIKFGEKYKNKFKLYGKYGISNSTTFFRSCRENRLPFLFDFEKLAIYFNLPCDNKFGFSPETFLTARNMHKNKSLEAKELTTKVLKMFDPTIEDIFIDFQEIAGGDSKLEIDIKHYGFSENVRLEHESKGTQNLFNLAFPLINILKNGGMVIYDEINASFHPDIQLTIIKHFLDPEYNQNNAQLIFSSHDYEATDKLLDKFQVNMVEKEDGYSTYYKLSDTGIRKDYGKASQVRSGIYGGTPDIIDFNYQLNELL